MRGNRQRLGGLLGFMLEGGVENAPELLTHVLGDRAGRQIELDQNRLPALDAVNEFPLCRFGGSPRAAEEAADWPGGDWPGRIPPERLFPRMSSPITPRSPCP
jgi:hypothetical protein